MDAKRGRHWKRFDTLDAILQRKALFRDDKRLSDTVDMGLGQFYMRMKLSKAKAPSGMLDDPLVAVPLVRGALALYGTGQLEAARDIVRNLKSDEVLEKAIETIVEEHFVIEEWRLLEN